MKVQTLTDLKRLSCFRPQTCTLLHTFGFASDKTLTKLLNSEILSHRQPDNHSSCEASSRHWDICELGIFFTTKSILEVVF